MRKTAFCNAEGKLLIIKKLQNALERAAQADGKSRGKDRRKRRRRYALAVGNGPFLLPADKIFWLTKVQLSDIFHKFAYRNLIKRKICSI